MSKITLPKSPYFILSLFCILLISFVWLSAQTLLKKPQGSEYSEILSKCPKDKTLCWKKIIQNTVRKDGLEAGFLLVEKQAKTDKSFAQVCHTMTHFLGHEAFQLYLNHQDLPIDFHRASFCGYGFYHGVIYATFDKTKDLKDAKIFCDHVKKRDPAKYTGVDFACYHGIGHALGEDVPDSALWDDPHRIVREASKKCTGIMEREDELQVCIEGVFTTFGNSVSTKKYPVKFNEQDPYWLCRTGDYNDGYKRACYSQMNFLTLKKTRYSLQQSLEYAVANAEARYLPSAVEGIGINYAMQHQEIPKFNRVVEICRALRNSDLQSVCIVGYMKGLISFGQPDREYERSLQFCALPNITGEEKERCYLEAGHLFQRLYPPAKAREVCSFAEKEYREACLTK